jgi:hypothetical protein
VTEQTELFGTDKVDIDVKGHTLIDGGVIASDKDDLKLSAIFPRGDRS